MEFDSTYAKRIVEALDAIGIILVAIFLAMFVGILVIGCPITPHNVHVEGSVHTR